MEGGESTVGEKSINLEENKHQKKTNLRVKAQNRKQRNVSK